MTLAERLQHFFSSAHLRGHAQIGITPASNNPIDVHRLEQLLETIKPPLRKARDFGILLDPWMMARLGRNEVRSAAVLAGLWSPHGGKPALDFLDSFLRLLDKQDAALPSRNDLNDGYVVRTEHCPMGDRADRVDLTIEGRSFLIGIEVKIDAPLDLEQLGRYRTSLDQRAGRHRRVYVIFLSPRAVRHDIGALKARWQDVAVAARTACSANEAVPLNNHMIKCFARHVAQFQGN